MKKLSVILLVVVALGCKEKRVFTKIVYNSCTGKYAIQTGIFRGDPLYYGDQPSFILFQDSVTGRLYSKRDTISGFTAGGEIVFDDSLSAVNFLLRIKAQQDSATARHLRSIIEKRIQDSIFKCQHTYQ